MSVRDLVKYQEDIQFQLTDSPKHIASILSSRQKDSDLPTYSVVKLFVVILDNNNSVMLPTPPTQGSSEAMNNSQLSIYDLPGLDINLIDDFKLGLRPNKDAEASINSWTFAVVTSEMGEHQQYGDLQMLYVAGAAPPVDICNEQSVVVVVACWVDEVFSQQYTRYTSISRVSMMNWEDLEIGVFGVEEVLRKLRQFAFLKHRRPNKSDVRTTHDGKSYFWPKASATGRPAIEAGSLNRKFWSVSAVSVKINGRRYVTRKHFARSKPANKRREELLRREQARNGMRRMAAIKAKQMALEDLQVAETEEASKDDVVDGDIDVESDDMD